jgi:hypothetical protein
MNETTERRRGRRPRLEKTWNAHIHLDEQHRERLTAMADAEGTTVSQVTRRLLDRALAEVAR